MIPCSCSLLSLRPRTPLPFSSNPSSHHLLPTAALSFPPPRRFLRRCRRRGSSSDPNAESIRDGRFRFQHESRGGGLGQDRRRRWWSDRNTEDGLEEEFGPSDDEDDDGEHLWDRIWIFKVFRGYGYMLPAIIASMLLATGPKAFLLALAVPLGQSVISLAIDKLWGSPGQEEPPIGPSSRTRRKPSSNFSADFRNREQDESSDESGGREDSPSWAATGPDSNDDKAAGSGRRSFGGWDELDREGEHARWRRRARSERPSRSRSPGVKMGKLSMEGRYEGAPLLLRLLIAVFPFLGSWMRML